jgi:hypothetical protein
MQVQTMGQTMDQMVVEMKDQKMVALHNHIAHLYTLHYTHQFQRMFDIHRNHSTGRKLDRHN